jgi:hypothetical protein
VDAGGATFDDGGNFSGSFVFYTETVAISKPSVERRDANLWWLTVVAALSRRL